MDDPKRRKILKKFGKKLREVRMEKGISIRGLADLADIDYSNLNRIEHGLVEVSLPTIYFIADALGIQPADLLP
jgi:transcriptional regulator with XRE-family HTH domain